MEVTVVLSDTGEKQCIAVASDDSVGCLKRRVLAHRGEGVVSLAVCGEVLGDDAERLADTAVTAGCEVGAHFGAGLLPARYDVRGATVTTVAFSPCAQRCIVGTRSGTVALWDTIPATQLWTYTTPGRVFAAVVAPSLQHSAAGGDRCMHIFDVQGRPLHVLTHHINWVHGVCFTPCSAEVVCCSHDRSVSVITVATGQCVVHITACKAALNVVRATRDRIVVGGCLPSLQVWDRAGQPCGELRGHMHAWVFALEVTRCGRWAVSGGCDTTVRVWSLSACECVRVLRGHEDAVLSVSVADGFLVSVGAAGDVRIWDSAGGDDACTVLQDSVATVLSAAVSLCGRWLALRSDHAVRIAAMASMEEVVV